MVMAGPFCRRAGLRGWSSSVSGDVYISRGNYSFLAPPLSALADLNGRDRPTWCWLMARLEEQYFVIVIKDYLRTTCSHVPGL